jgi:hypothetical protein
MVGDSGKVLRFGLGDLGWCTLCQVYLLVSTKMGGNYAINVRALSTREILSESSTYLQKSFNTFRGTECMYFTARVNTDIVYNIRTQ